MSDENESKPSLGPTGKFPLGKLGPSDQGELSCGISVADELVIVRFGTVISWFALKAPEARELAASLLRAAEKAEQAEKEVPGEPG
jgi:hypothetical protein